MNRVIIGICLIGLIFGGAEELLAQRGAGRGPQGRGFGRYGMQSDQGMRGQLGAQQGNFGNRTDAGRRSVQDATDLAKMWEEEKAGTGCLHSLGCHEWTPHLSKHFTLRTPTHAGDC